MKCPKCLCSNVKITNTAKSDYCTYRRYKCLRCDNVVFFTTEMIAKDQSSTRLILNKIRSKGKEDGVV